MCKRKTPTYIDPMEEMIAQIREDERNSEKFNIVFSMIRGNEPDEKIAKYTRLDVEKVREAKAVYVNMAKVESELKSRIMNYRNGHPPYCGSKGLDHKNIIEKIGGNGDKKRNLLQVLGYDSGARPHE